MAGLEGLADLVEMDVEEVMQGVQEARGARLGGIWVWVALVDTVKTEVQTAAL